MTTTDIELIHQTARGDRQAFGQLVERYQSLVCSVAYSVVGDFARSEDVAQEAFLTAWTRLSELREPEKFVAWICGISRNLALMVIRKERRSQPADPVASSVSLEPSPLDQASAREEESLVWHALEALPESYREPLVLFYREQNSVARVAQALELSEDAVKQRLSRGREMLREEIAATIERTLRRTAPQAAFVLAVLGALPGIGATSAVAATAVTTGKAAGSMAATSTVTMVGSLLGGGIGLAGGLFGLWAGDQSTRYPRERALFRKGMLPYLLAYVFVFPAPFLAMEFGWWNPVSTFGPIGYGLSLITWILAFFVGSFLWIWRVIRGMQRIVTEDVASGATRLPLSPVQKYAARFAARYEGRRWTSRWKLFGIPLIDIQFQDPPEDTSTFEWRTNRRPAFGWFAMGDRACGFIACGGIAYGVIANGGIAFGGIAIGGFCVGGLALGGLGIGLVSLSGLSIGLLSAGGLSLGWAATGGLAVGWLAFGGGAVAWRAAKGGLAIAHDFAIGGTAHAAHANDADSTAFIEQSWFFQNAEPAMMSFSRFFLDHQLVYNIGLAIFIFTSIFAGRFTAYRRREANVSASQPDETV